MHLCGAAVDVILVFVYVMFYCARRSMRLTMTEVPEAVVLTEAEAALQKARDQAPKIQRGIIHYSEEFTDKNGKWVQKGYARFLVAFSPR